MAKKSDGDFQTIDESPNPATVFKLVVFLVVFAYAVAFILSNSKKVEISFVFFTVQSRAWLGFIASLVIGALLGLLIGWARKRGRD